MCSFIFIGMRRHILCHCVLERYNLLSYFKISDFQDIALSVRGDFRTLNNVGTPKDYEDHRRLNAFSPQDETETIVTRATMFS